MDIAERFVLWYGKERTSNQIQPSDYAIPIDPCADVYKTLSHEELVHWWLKHYHLNRVLRRNLESIESRLWAVPDGPMCRRLWREVIHS